MVPFAGWHMPVQYSSIIEEHMAVRNKSGLFDVSHMGEITVSGPNSVSFLESVTCNLVEDMPMGMVRYNALVNDNGGLVDDIIVYRTGPEEFFIVVNASNTDAAFDYLQLKNSMGVTLKNESSQWHQIALQGPASQSVMKEVFQLDLSELKYYRYADFQLDGIFHRISRTGYTGEDGFEIYTDAARGIEVWNRLLSFKGEGAPIPAGLGARDSLRLEVRYPLYGHELNENRTPVESGIGWIVKEKKIHFPAYNRIIEQKKNGSEGLVTGFVLQESGVPREGYPVYIPGEGSPVGEVLSGGHSPVLKKGIGTVFLQRGKIMEGAPLEVEIRKRRLKAVITTKPFLKGSAKKN